MKTSRFVRTVVGTFIPLVVTSLIIAALPSRAATAIAEDIGTLLVFGENSHGYGISDSGRAVGVCFTDAASFYLQRSFSTRPNATLVDNTGDDFLHNHIDAGLPQGILDRSTTWDIWHPVTGGNYRVVGETYLNGEARAFWHEEQPGG